MAKGQTFVLNVLECPIPSFVSVSVKTIEADRFEKNGVAVSVVCFGNSDFEYERAPSTNAAGYVDLVSQELETIVSFPAFACHITSLFDNYAPVYKKWQI
jgi:hypothetical protein